MSDSPYITQTAAEASVATRSGARTTQATTEASVVMGSDTRTTQAVLEISAAASTAARMSNAAAEMSVAATFSTRMTHAALLASTSGVFAARATLLCAEISVTRPGTERIAVPVRVFSTGTLFAVSGGTRIEMALLQNVTVRFTAEAKRLYDCPIRSALPIDTAFTGGEAMLRAEQAAISPNGVAQLLGGSLADLTAYQLLTLAKGIAKLPFQAILTAMDTAGRPHQWTFGNVFCPTLTLPAAAVDFLKPQFEMTALPDRNGIVAIVQLAE